MSLTIDLLGSPAVSIGDHAAPPPRGRKAWALLAYLLLTPRPAPRERLAGLLFGEAADPLGALRWNLAELRRLLGPGATIGGEAVQVRLPPGSVVDVDVVVRGTWVQATRIPGLGRALLEGIELPDSPTFEAWLLAERSRFATISASILREAATARLASGDARSAIELASRLVAIEDFDEEAHALLIRAYAAAGDHPSARRQSAISIDHLRRELGLEPSAVLVRALDTAPLRGAVAGPERARGTRALDALIEAGRAAVNAGAVDAGLETLRRAAAEAEGSAHPDVIARARLALGVALVHGGRGRDGEGATWLHAALASAEPSADPIVRSDACRELGYIEFLRARYDRAEAWLERAMREAPDDAERAAALGVSGAVSSDRGRTEVAIASLTEAAAVGQAASKPRVEAWARVFLGRTYLLRDELAHAARELDRAMELCRASGWMSFAPWPQGLRAEVHLRQGDVDTASDMFEATFAVGCQIGDPCWEGIGARGIGLVRLAQGSIEEGIRWLDDARVRCVRIPDAYLWIHAYCLDALCASGLEHHRPEASSWIADLTSLAARTGMREMLVRSHLHRSVRDGGPALEAARLFVPDIDNPALARRLAPAVGVA